MKNNSKQKFILLWLAGILVFGLLLTLSNTYQTTLSVQSKVNERLTLLHEQFNHKMYERIKALATLSQNAAVQDLLLAGKPMDVPGGYPPFNLAKTLLQPSVVYLMKTDGTVIASSHIDGKRTRVGFNYQTRPYVQQALSGQPSVYPDMSNANGKKSIYYAVPVQQNGALLGVLAARYPLKDCQLLLDKEHGAAFLTNADGMVFLTNMKKYANAATRPLSQKQAKNATKNPPVVLPLNKPVVTIQGVRYRMKRQPLPMAGWHLHFGLKASDQQVSVDQQIQTNLLALWFILTAALYTTLMFTRYQTRNKTID